MLKKWLTVGLVLVSLFLWSYVATQLLIYLLSYQQNNQVIQSLLFSDGGLSQVESVAPRDISVSDVQIYTSSGDYDYVVDISNPNKKWLLTFDYRFSAPDENPSFKQGYVLPASADGAGYIKIMDFSRMSDSPRFEIKNLKWRKIDNFDYLKNKMHNFSIENDIFTIGNEREPSVLSFDLINYSPYSYWSMDIQVTLFNGGMPTGINHILVNGLKTGEKRRIDLLWNYSLPSKVDYDFNVDVNFLDRNNIMPVGQ